MMKLECFFIHYFHFLTAIIDANNNNKKPIISILLKILSEIRKNVCLKKQLFMHSNLLTFTFVEFLNNITHFMW